MKKFGLVAFAALFLCAVFLLGCAAVPTEVPVETESAQATESASTQPAENAEQPEEEAEAQPALKGDYMSWTAAEWEDASDDERMAATEMVLTEVGDAMIEGYSEMLETAKSDESIKKLIDEQVESMKSQIENFLNTDSSVTIQDLVDISKEIATSTVE